MNKNDVFKIVLDVEKNISKNNYEGYDPFDALNSKVLNIFPLNKSKYYKIFITQIFKYSPINLRNFFMTNKGRNPKGLGLLLSVYANLFKYTNDYYWIENTSEIINWLNNNANKKFSGKSWGYNFDWQNRAFYLPKNTPTIVNTAFIAHGILDIYEITKSKQSLLIVKETCEFILNSINKTYVNDTFCFSYSPIDKSNVHNANLLGASVLARFSKITDQTHWKDEISKSTLFSINKQNKDGSWYYGLNSYQNWIDSFHTGFNLIALNYINMYLDQEDLKIKIDKGEKFYLNKFFIDENGLSKYYNNKIYPIDIHCPSMALAYFYNKDISFELYNKILSWMIDNMYLYDKYYFIYQINKFYKNKINYIRWSQCWALYGLSFYLLSENE